MAIDSNKNKNKNKPWDYPEGSTERKRIIEVIEVRKGGGREGKCCLQKSSWIFIKQRKAQSDWSLSLMTLKCSKTYFTWFGPDKKIPGKLLSDRTR